VVARPPGQARIPHRRATLGAATPGNVDASVAPAPDLWIHRPSHVQHLWTQCPSHMQYLCSHLAAANRICGHNFVAPLSWRAAGPPRPRGTGWIAGPSTVIPAHGPGQRPARRSPRLSRIPSRRPSRRPSPCSALACSGCAGFAAAAAPDPSLPGRQGKPTRTTRNIIPIIPFTQHAGSAILLAIGSQADDRPDRPHFPRRRSGSRSP